MKRTPAFSVNDETLLTIAELADILGMSEAGIRAMRARREGPASIKVGVLVRYRRADIEAWLNERYEGGAR